MWEEGRGDCVRVLPPGCPPSLGMSGGLDTGKRPPRACAPLFVLGTGGRLVSVGSLLLRNRVGLGGSNPVVAQSPLELGCDFSVSRFLLFRVRKERACAGRVFPREEESGALNYRKFLPCSSFAGSTVPPALGGGEPDMQCKHLIRHCLISSP